MTTQTLQAVYSLAQHCNLEAPGLTIKRLPGLSTDGRPCYVAHGTDAALRAFLPTIARANMTLDGLHPTWPGYAAEVAHRVDFYMRHARLAHVD